ncbi:hypothetical protein EDB85DRAFT_2000688 [Lactarius pseudohatsudake]|nr:hypothetical protein EDB85DRAFT_2000688 [Lactarius pseudohatsudake]
MNQITDYNDYNAILLGFIVVGSYCMSSDRTPVFPLRPSSVAVDSLLRIMHSKKVHLFSMTTPIRPEVTTYIDLGDTKRSQPSFTPTKAEQPAKDKSSMPPTWDSQRAPIVDLRNFTVKREEDVPGHEKITKITEKNETNIKEETGHGVQNRATDMAATGTSLLDQPVASCSASTGSRTVVSDKGLKVVRHITSIKRTGVSTRWYIVLNSGAIQEPPLLHSTIDLELGDLFLNKYLSASHGKDVLQVWLLLSGEGGYYWSQVSSKVSGKTEHPKLPGFVLSFLPSDLSSPSWVRRNTERRRRERPRILAPGEGTFTDTEGI